MSADSTFLQIEQGAHMGDYGENHRSHPSDAQKAVGNYKKGQIAFFGLQIAIEQPRGTYRSGFSEGKRWTTRMAAHYGYIKGTRSSDGDAVDCFVGFYPQSELVFIINQFINGSFDEPKVMLAFPDQDSAERAYRQSYDRNWNGLKSIVPASISQLKWWLKNGNKNRAVTAEDLPYEGLEEMNKNVTWDSAANPVGVSIEQLLYQVRRSDAGENLLMDAVTMADILADSDGEIALDAMVTPYARIERKMEVLRGILERTGINVKPLSVQISQPFKQRGTTNVAAIFELSDGQTVSIYFHNPDTTPNKLAPTDELISWKWLVNRKDCTVIVAPERGEDLNPREVARRLMRLVEKNSPAFQRANAKRTETMQRLQGLKDEISTLETELSSAMRELEVAKVEAETKPRSVAGVSGRSKRYESYVKTIRGASDAEGLPPGFRQSIESDSELWSGEAADLIEMIGNAFAPEKDPARNWISGDGLRNLCESRGIAVSDVDEEDDVLRASLEKNGMRASLESKFARSWQITEIGENYGSGFEVSAEVLSNALDAFVAASGKSSAIDPASPEGYAQVTADPELQRKHGATLDKLFADRASAVRDSLKALGWTQDAGAKGYSADDLSKSGIYFKVEFKSVDGSNAIGATYVISGGAGTIGEMQDDLTKTPAEIAAEIDASVQPAIEKQEETLPSGWAESRSGGMITNPEVLTGGIVDTMISTGEWFFIANDERIKNQEGFATRGEALAALLAAIEAIKDTPEIVVSGNELGDFPDTDEGKKMLRSAAKAFLSEMRGEWIDCPILGKQVEIRQRGIKETIAFSADPRKLKLIPAIRQIISTAASFSKEENHKLQQKPDVLAYFKLKNTVSIGGESPVSVSVVVAEDSLGAMHYDMIIDRDDAETKTALDCSSAAPVSTLPPDHNSGNADNQNIDSGDPEVKLDSASSGMVLNLFIEGEEDDEIIDMQPEPALIDNVIKAGDESNSRKSVQVEGVAKYTLTNADDYDIRLTNTGLEIEVFRKDGKGMRERSDGEGWAGNFANNFDPEPRRAIFESGLVVKEAVDPQPDPVTPEDPAVNAEKAADVAFFQSIVDGTIDDILQLGLGKKMKAAYLRHEGDAEIAGLFERAVNAYQAAMMAATANL